MHPQGADVMGDEVLGALDDPGEIADAQSFCFQQRRGERQPAVISRSDPAASTCLALHL
jgi:hypothetical protein